MKKNVLYFMPDNPMRNNAGNKTRTLQMLEYFKSRHEQIELDFVSEKYWGGWEDADIMLFKTQFPHCRLFVLNRKLPRRNKIRYVLAYKIPNYIKKYKWLVKKAALPNNNTHILQKSFNKLLKKKEYDYIIISYVTWATLIEKNPLVKGAILINDTHDLITAQLKNKKSFSIGESFGKEMKLLSLFDQIWSLSYDEQYLFSQFVSAYHEFIPIMYQDNYAGRKADDKYKYDLLFVGSDNENNIKSIHWFFSRVYPLLPESLKICVIGKITGYVSSYQNVEKLNFVEDLSDYYFKSKIALCPMLSGTGVKVKVVEALSYGLPVVCNLRGLDGLPQKENNGCLRGDTPDAFAGHIIDLLTNETLYQHTRKLAIKMFDAYFDKTHCYEHLDKIFAIAN